MYNLHCLSSLKRDIFVSFHAFDRVKTRLLGFLPTLKIKSVFSQGTMTALNTESKHFLSSLLFSTAGELR